MNISVNELKNLAKNPIYMAYAVSIGALLLLGYLLIWKLDIESMNKCKKEQERIVKNIKKVQDISKYKTSLKEFNKLSVVRKGANWLVENITELAKKNKVVLGYVEPLDSFEENDYAVQKVLVEGSGSYFDIVQFLLMVENNEKYTYIEELQLTADNPKYKDMETEEKGVLNKESQGLFYRKGMLKMIVITLSKR